MYQRLYHRAAITTALLAEPGGHFRLVLRKMSDQDDNAVFVGKGDRFKGVTVVSGEEPCPREQFARKLKESLKNWMEKGIRGVWFHVNLPESEWVPVLAENGFVFHHARPDRVAMIKWLPKDEENQIPAYSHHVVGVGGMVINDKDEILAVQEKFSRQPSWKLPGGYVDPGENFPDAAVREVKEETGIDTEFVSLVAFRHAHGYNYDCSDLYVIIQLRPLSHAITACPRELADCRWMALADFVQDPLVNNVNQFFARQFLENRRKGICIGRKEMELKLKDFVRPQQVYCLSDEVKLET